jgi:CoA:oxalate CoA-transferase
MSGCLEGIRVLELARFQAGPRCGMILSDLGAEVIKIEKPGGEETRKHPPIVNGQSLYFSTYNRGKKSIRLDLRQEDGKQVFEDLLKTADFVIENFRPGTLVKMGLDYESLCKVKQDIILLSASAFGQYGPYWERVGFDGIGQAMSGLMTLTGKAVGQPVPTASSIVDRTTALHMTIGALAALRHRELTGQGQVIDVCLLDSALTMVEIPTSHYLSTGIDEHEITEIQRSPYRAKDGWVIIQTASHAMSQALRDLIGECTDQNGPHSEDEGPITREWISSWCADLTVADVCTRLNERGIVGAPVLSIPEVAQDPHLWAREMLVKIDDPIGGEIFVPGLTIKFSKTPGKIGPVPMLGEHTEEILGHLPGYDSDRIDRLREAGVV